VYWTKDPQEGIVSGPETERGANWVGQVGFETARDLSHRKIGDKNEPLEPSLTSVGGEESILNHRKEKFFGRGKGKRSELEGAGG